MATYSYDSLTPRLREKAIAELNEKPERLKAHLTSLRRWLRQCPHLICPSDDLFLLRFLRAAKFEQEKAEQRIENFCTIRGSPDRGLPHKFDYPAPDHQDLAAYLQMGVHVPLEHPDVDETLVIIRFSQWDASKFNYERLLTFTFMTMEVLTAAQKSQIGGLGVIIDMGNIGNVQLEQMQSMQLLRECVHVWLRAFPMRNRYMLFCHESPLIDIGLEVFKMCLKPKQAARIIRVKSDVSKIQDKIPGGRAVLPTEFGGDNGPLEDWRRRWEARFRDHWASNCAPDIGVDEAKRPANTLTFLNHDEHR